MTAMLLDHLWQSTLFALAAAALTLMLRRNGAHVRYWLWFAASMKFLVPLAPLVALGAALVPQHRPVLAPPVTAVTAVLTQPFSGSAPVLTAPAAPAASLVAVLCLLWALGAVALFVHWAIRWIRIDTVGQWAKLLPLQAPVAVKEAPAHFEPGLFGILRPVLLLPAGLREKLSEREVDAVIAHEICHLKRRDNLTAMLHLLVQALFWFFPLVWWLGARLIDERERACDEAVVAGGNQADIYAESVLKVCRLYLHSPLVCTAGVSGADLKRRMEAIMAGRPAAPLHAGKKALLALFAAASLAVPLTAGLLTAAGAQSGLPSESDLARAFAEQAQPRTAIALNPHDFDRFTGFYRLSSYEFIHVFRNGGHFMVQFTGQIADEVFPESPVKFFTRGYPWQVQFEAAANGTVTGLVLHRAGWVRPVPKVEDRVALAALAVLDRRIRNRTPSPGTETAVRRQIAALEAGRTDTDSMEPLLAAAALHQQASLLATIRQLGSLRRFQFQGVAGNGWDIYLAMFEHGKLQWLVAPLSAAGKVEMQAIDTPP